MLNGVLVLVKGEERGIFLFDASAPMLKIVVDEATSHIDM